MGNLKGVGKRSAILKLEFPSEKEAEVFLKSLKPETNSPATPRSRVWIEQDGSFLIFHFEASDTTALRASLNSYLSWLHLLKDVHKTLNMQI